MLKSFFSKLILPNNAELNKIRLLKLGFNREKTHPMESAWCKDVKQDSSHYKRLRIFTDSMTVIVFENIANKYSRPLGDPNNKETGHITFSGDIRKKNSVGELKSIVKRFKF